MFRTYKYQIGSHKFLTRSETQITTELFIWNYLQYRKVPILDIFLYWIRLNKLLQHFYSQNFQKSLSCCEAWAVMTTYTHSQLKSGAYPIPYIVSSDAIPVFVSLAAKNLPIIRLNSIDFR